VKPKTSLKLVFNNRKLVWQKLVLTSLVVIAQVLQKCPHIFIHIQHLYSVPSTKLLRGTLTFIIHTVICALNNSNFSVGTAAVTLKPSIYYCLENTTKCCKSVYQKNYKPRNSSNLLCSFSFNICLFCAKLKNIHKTIIWKANQCISISCYIEMAPLCKSSRANSI